MTKAEKYIIKKKSVDVVGKLYLRLTFGIGIKTFGYFLIAAGIFLGFRYKEMAAKIIFIGISFIMLGWALVIYTLKVSALLKLPTKKTRFGISAHLKNGIIKKGQVVEVEGKLRGLKSGNIKVLLNGKKILESYVEDVFKFQLTAPEVGKHTIELRYIGDVVLEPKKLSFQVMEEEKFENFKRSVRFFYLLSFLFYLLIFIICFFVILS